MPIRPHWEAGPPAQQLRTELKNALENEAYERAAEIRDRLRDLEEDGG